MTTYTITTWTESDGTQYAKWGDQTAWALDKIQTLSGWGGKHELARRMIDAGCNPTARVYFVNENGGKLGSARSLAELGRVKA